MTARADQMTVGFTFSGRLEPQGFIAFVQRASHSA